MQRLTHTDYHVRFILDIFEVADVKRTWHANLSFICNLTLSTALFSTSKQRRLCRKEQDQCYLSGAVDHPLLPALDS